MSNNYYLVEKKKYEQTIAFQKKIQETKEMLQKELPIILGEDAIDFEFDIKAKTEQFDYLFNDMLEDWGRIHICQTTSSKVTYKHNLAFSTVAEFKLFYELNQNMYIIIDEYDEIVELQRFLEIVKGKEEKWVNYDFC